jgi:hypothetical protein
MLVNYDYTRKLDTCHIFCWGKWVLWIHEVFVKKTTDTYSMLTVLIHKTVLLFIVATLVLGYSSDTDYYFSFGT